MEKTHQNTVRAAMKRSELQKQLKNQVEQAWQDKVLGQLAKLTDNADR